MDNPEFIELRNKFLFGLFIATIIVIAGVLLFTKKFGDKRSTALEQINKNETFLLLVVDSKNCNNCRDLKSKLNSLNINYIQYDIHKSSDLDDICYKLGINKNNFTAPSLIFIKDGDKEASILDISNTEEMEIFLNSYGFID